MTHVQRSHLEAKLQGRDTDSQIFKADRDTLSGLLTFDAPDHASYFNRHRMHRNDACKPLDKGQPL